MASGDEIQTVLHRVKSACDEELSLLLMREMLNRIDSGDPTILPFLADWAAHAFRRVLVDGVSAGQAFGLEPERGKYDREDTTERDIMCVSQYVLSRRNGSSRLDAIGDTANKYFPDGAGEKAIEAAIKKYHDVLCLLPDETLMSMAGE